MSVRNGSRRVRSQRNSVDWGTMGPALGGAYEFYAQFSSFSYVSKLITGLIRCRRQEPPDIRIARRFSIQHGTV